MKQARPTPINGFSTFLRKKGKVEKSFGRANVGVEGPRPGGSIKIWGKGTET